MIKTIDSSKAKVTEYGFGGEVIALDGQKVSTGPAFISNRRAFLLKGIVQELKRAGFYIHEERTNSSNIKYEIWLIDEFVSSAEETKYMKFSLNLYVPKKKSVMGAISNLAITNKVAEILGRRVVYNMVEISPNLYLRLMRRAV